MNWPRNPKSDCRNPKQCSKVKFEISNLNARRFSIPGILLSAGFFWTCLALAEYPKPSPYPISWELKFEHDEPRRVVLDVPGSSVPKAYWYITYTVTNESDQEQLFLPVFEMLTRDGRVIRSDRNIPQPVFDRIKRREGKQFLEPFTTIGGEIRIGEDEARDGVAIWEEPDRRMGAFSIFVTGLSGETALAKDARGQEMKDAEGKPIILRKTLQVDYEIPGDEVFAGEDEIKQTGKQWVMR